LVLKEWISQSDIASKAKPEMWDLLRSPFQSKQSCLHCYMRWLAFYSQLENICMTASFH